MTGLHFLLTISALIASAVSFGGSEDKFLKKYAMMKIYENCFGPEVVKQIRKEMKVACAKCASLEVAPTPRPTQADTTPQQLPFEVDKFHQAVWAYRPNSPANSYYRPYPASSFYGVPYMSQSGYPMMYPVYQPYSNQYPTFGQSYYGSSRISRDMDIKSQLEALSSKMSGRVKNVTCVMQELGYLDDNLEPHYKKITERITALSVTDELKKDMQDGVAFCQQFSQCVPDVKKDRSPLSRELVRPMFFFKCYKHKKLEACIMKDVREKYAGVTDEDLENDLEIKRAGRQVNPSQFEDEINELSTSMYDLLYGSESNIELEGF